MCWTVHNKCQDNWQSLVSLKNGSSVSQISLVRIQIYRCHSAYNLELSIVERYILMLLTWRRQWQAVMIILIQPVVLAVQWVRLCTFGLFRADFLFTIGRISLDMNSLWEIWQRSSPLWIGIATGINFHSVLSMFGRFSGIASCTIPF